MINILGIGPGGSLDLTLRNVEVLSKSPFVVGTTRQLEGVRAYIKQESAHYNGRLEHLKSIIDESLKKHKSITLLASGDPNFYGISQWVYRTYTDHKIEIITGIGSHQILFAKTGIPMHDVFLTSLHGRPLVQEELTKYKRLCLLTDQEKNPYFIAQTLLKLGVNPLMVIGESLSYPNETITIQHARDVLDKKYEMNVVIIDYER